MQRKVTFVTTGNSTEIQTNVASPPRRSVNKLEQPIVKQFHHAYLVESIKQKNSEREKYNIHKLN